MCGLVGVLAPRQGNETERREIVRRMADTLVHRGPDGEGYASPEGCDFGFRRLAIIDVAADSPPYANEDRSIWSMANAEIYNSADIVPVLEAKGHRLRTHVDTEVIPHLYEEFGVDLVDHLNGMFAFCVWDERTRTLMLGRDRTGEKPIFYTWNDGELVFASELRAILAHPNAPRAVDPVAIRRYLLHDYFPAPLSPIAGINKLPAGHVLTVRDGRLDIRCYWDLADYFDQPRTAAMSPTAIADEIDERLALAVNRRRRADVPVGVFLSGGIDSSAVLAHLADQTGPGVPAFSLGHTDLNFDESRFARDTARFFKADFNELVLTEDDLADGLRRVAVGFDEPLGDASIIPTHLLSLFAVEKVKVVLSGEGADELFAGYPTYIGNRVAGWYRKMPSAVRRSLVAGIRKLLPVSMGNVSMDYLLSRFSAAAERELVERHHTWFGSLRPERHPEILSRRMMSALTNDDPFGSARQRVAGKEFPDPLSVLLYTDFTMYLQDDLLTKVDRATMLASLEARTPFLDHDFTEFVAGIPSKYKLQGITTKAILRRAVKKRLPREVLKRRKRGFNIPFSRWLLHGLGEQLRERFSTERVEARGLLDPVGMSRLIDEHMSRRTDHRKPLFSLLALDLWCDATYGEGAPVPIADGTTGQTVRAG
ncbi:MAG: asparagine synthase (glutamine-hydrolyzing) [Candidatus Sulfomarinibacteraceae bacterium]